MKKWEVERLRFENLAKDRDITLNQIRQVRAKTAFCCQGHHIFISPLGDLCFSDDNRYSMSAENALALADWIKDVYSEATE